MPDAIDRMVWHFGHPLAADALQIHASFAGSSFPYITDPGAAAMSPSG